MGDVSTCRLIDLPKFSDGRGSLSFIEPPLLPFEIQRVYYLYDLPAGAVRGAHGHRRLEQLIVAVSGSLEVELDDGRARRVFTLTRPDQGLYVTPMMWRHLRHFSDGAVAMVLASLRFDEADYFRNYDDFLAEVHR
jgi:dTDP-4-dehydrorhamnose 3,5-epimerase-like enzyme